MRPRFKSTKGKYDLFVPFIEKGTSLLKSSGLLSLIVPSMFTKRDYGKDIRRFIRENSRIKHLVYFGDFQVFDGVTIFPFIFIFSKDERAINDTVKITNFRSDNRLTHSLVNTSLKNNLDDRYSVKYEIKADRLKETPWSIADENTMNLKNKITNIDTCLPLKEITKYIFVGYSASGKDEVFYVSKEVINEYKLEAEITVPIYKGKDIHSYFSKWSGKYCIYPYDKVTNKVISEKELKTQFPNVHNYLLTKKYLLKGRGYFDNSNKKWYELWCERNYIKFSKRKIMNAEISSNNRFYLDEDGMLGNTKTFSTVLNNEWSGEYYYILGLLNSKVIEFFHKQVSVPKAGGFFEYKTQFLNLYPIKKINYLDLEEKSKHDSLVSFVEKILEAYKQLQDAQTEQSKIQTKRKIQSLNNSIDQLVYELYELSPEEIKIVEGEG